MNVIHVRYTPHGRFRVTDPAGYTFDEVSRLSAEMRVTDIARSTILPMKVDWHDNTRVKLVRVD